MLSSNIRVKLRRHEFKGIVSFGMYAHKDDMEKAANILHELQPKTNPARLPKWKAEEINNAIVYTIIILILFILFLTYLSYR